MARTTSLAGRELPLGDFSHALLGVLDSVAAPASLGLRALALGDLDRFRAIMEPCEAFGRWVFGPPTEHYKTGLAFVAWLAGCAPPVQVVALPGGGHLFHGRLAALRAAAADWVATLGDPRG